MSQFFFKTMFEIKLLEKKQLKFFPSKLFDKVASLKLKHSALK